MNATQFYKQDRVMRLMRVLALFQAKPHGLTTREIADRLEVSQRTAQRDLLHLQSELHVPFVGVGSRWVLPSQFFLAPVSFNVHEGMAMLISARLMLRFADKANLFAKAAYEKVAAALRSQPWDTIIGKLSFDPKGDLTSSTYVWYVFKGGNYAEAPMN